MTDSPTRHLPRRTSPAGVQRFHQGAVVSRTDASGAVALNPTALALWDLCDGQTTVDEMVAAVCELFGLEYEHARRDVEAALERMRELGVVR